jgi:anti-sigma factor RsiW
VHLTDEQVQRFVDGELPQEDRLQLEKHLAPCAECRERLAAARQGAEEVLARLRILDHPVPRLSAETVIRLARPRQPGFGRWAAAILLSFGLAGVAYATPGSPLPRWINTLSAWISSDSDPSPDPTVPPPAPVPGSAGIAVLPGEKLAILFQLDAAGGSARISLTDGSEVVVRAESGAAGFTAGDDQLVIVGQADTTSFEVEIPRSAPRVEILLRGTRVFLKAGDRVTTKAVPAQDGSYHLSLNP